LKPIQVDEPVPVHFPTIWALIEAKAAATPDAPLLVDDRHRSMTHAEYRDAALRAAAGLYALGIDEGTKVSWQIPTVMESAVLLGALSRLGAVQNPLVPILRRRDAGFIVKQTGADVMIVPGVWRSFDYEAMARDIAEEVGCQVIVTGHPDLSTDGSLALPDGDPATLPPLAAPPEDPANLPVRWIFYSSGTTGSPKGALHTDVSIMNGPNGMITRLDMGPKDRYPMVFPITHIGGIGVMVFALETGCPLILMETFNMVDSPMWLAEQGATFLGSTVPFFHAYMDAQRRFGTTPLYPGLRAFLGGGAPKPPDLHFEVQQVLPGCRGIISSWGLTEFPMATYCSADDSDEDLAHTEGRLVPGVELRVVSFEGADVGPGFEGELRLRGPQQFRGYLDSSLNADALDDQGYFRTGDLGIVGPQGHVRITGRMKDVIIRNAENISAREVEEVVFGHDKIRDVAIIGVPDPKTGERCCAVVELNDPNDTLTLAELAEFCRATGLTTQKIPERLELVTDMPRNAMGKIAKQELRKQFS
jgi:cyclohexanecarboxylate-CoA ligase